MNRPSPVWLPVLISLGIHLISLILAPFILGSYSAGDVSPSKKERIMKVRFLDNPKRIRDIRGQLVDIMDHTQSLKNAPDNARFLSNKNRSVGNEMQSRVTGPNPTSGFGQNRSLDQAQNQTQKPKLTLPDSFFDEPVRRKHQASLAPTNYLPEVAIGDQTLLNTRDYVYASYFIRMKRQMEANWNPRRALYSTPVSRLQYITTVRIILNQDGSLYQVFLIDPSGHGLLDKEALAAVRRAAPYLNPPSDLIEPDGKIRIPHWHFIVSNHAFM